MEGGGAQEWSSKEVQREVVRAIARLRRLLTLENLLAESGQDNNNSPHVRQIPPLLLLMADHAKTVLSDLNDYGSPRPPRRKEETAKRKHIEEEEEEERAKKHKRKQIEEKEEEEPYPCRPSTSPSSLLSAEEKPIPHSSSGPSSSLPSSYQEKLEASRRRLCDNYRKANGAKRRQTIKLVDIKDIPLPASIVKNTKKSPMIPRRRLWFTSCPLFCSV